MRLYAIPWLRRAACITAQGATWILYLFAILGAFAGWINPEKWALPSMLALAMPPLIVMCTGATVAWGAYHWRRPCAVGGYVTCLILLYPFFTLCPISVPQKPRPGEKILTVLSYNSFYCNDTQFENPVRSRTLDYIINSRADVVCLQELYSLDAAGTHGKATETQIANVKRLYPYRLEPGDRELVILSRFPIKALEGSSGKLFFQWQSVEVDYNGTPVTIVNVHMPSFGLDNGERQIVRKMGQGSGGIREGAREMRRTIYGKLAEAFATRARAAEVIRDYCRSVKGNLIVCGDFNDVPGSYTYRTVRSAGLKDLYTSVSSGYTFTFNAYLMFFHIDQMLYRGNLRGIGFTRGDVESSDHYPITGTFALPAKPKKSASSVSEQY